MPILIITPDSGKAGDKVALQSSGWTPNAQLVYEWPAINFRIDDLRADESGRFDRFISIDPLLKPGTYKVRMYERLKPTNIAEATFTSTNLTPGTKVVTRGNPVYFFNGDQVGPSPAQARKTITWLGNLKSAILVVNFANKPGWVLEQATLNGKNYAPTSHNNISAEVKDALINGDNTLTIHYATPFLTPHLGDRNTLTAYIIPDVETIAGLSGIVSDMPSLDLLVKDIDKRLANATIPTIIILVAIAIISVAIAAIFGKVGGFL
ncbi:hypothetical protein Ngar_c03610 [Candidatus Nitrososphaera gargensis Ga9.2]|uniref:Uncharacterized protein n=1 Tax=Nitrososphaera gargensis (strain Ga9.2) TaxID=1237085 RepID=K0ILT1_NITGG|nr:hypothetical protein [Candidatus Nitrososphaera gargensis]AFU57280.1 hypothetical protein Ngar_c03320 [Candidatus Nitrososphaera gargensis Ga9.2]AFU57309.1 hypothetical protein Ngar_c03610 [Candidatus Nitrososphaera gargensis Ga9.2]